MKQPDTTYVLLRKPLHVLPSAPPKRLSNDMSLKQACAHGRTDRPFRQTKEMQQFIVAQINRARAVMRRLYQRLLLPSLISESVSSITVLSFGIVPFPPPDDDVRIWYTPPETWLLTTNT